MLSEWECKKRWKCPTDRELALRAKINTGWSIHTANVFLKPEAFERNELQAIERVIQRANDLERLEIERVGRMVCKLENMARYALGDGEKNCSMCGTTFGIFRSSYVKCVDCGKAVCEKCRVDTLTASLDICMLCKICSENREVWKKSGGWFYGKLPTITAAYQEKCENQTTGSPSPVRGFDTWSHRAPDIVRLQSYEPPEENHNDNSYYTSWTRSPDKTDIISEEDINQAEKDESDHSQHKNSPLMNSIPDIRCDERGELTLEQPSVLIQPEDLILIDSIPDLVKDRATPPSTEPEISRKRSDELLSSNYLSVQSTRRSCPTPIDSQEPCKLRRKASIRRKRSSAPTRGNLPDK